jgi:hypothetical protein
VAARDAERQTAGAQGSGAAGQPDDCHGHEAVVRALCGIRHRRAEPIEWPPSVEVAATSCHASNNVFEKGMRMFKTQWRWVVCTLLAIPSAPAVADVQATYARGNTDEETVTVELAEDGALRVSQRRYRDLSYFLFVDGQTYTVEAGPGGPTVATVEAATERTRRNREGMTILGEGFGGTDESIPIHYAPVDATKIAGYDGIRYNFPGAYDAEATQIVLSDDPTLKPLGSAFAAYAQAKDVVSGSEDETTDNLDQLLPEHGVLAIWGYELKSISFAPVARSRFAVPAAPLTLSEIPQADITITQPTETELIQLRTFIVSAAFQGETLYALWSDGRLQAWSEGAENGKDVMVPTLVRAFCVHENDLFLATGNWGEGTVRLWAGAPGAWSVAAAFAESESDPFLALDCSGPQPVMLSARAIRLPTEGRSIAIASGEGSPFGASSTLTHGGFLYAGLNAGEFGGGLMRFPLTGGEGEYLDASDPQELCGGVLNKDCHPVTGLAVDPLRPDCILASVGLNHMSLSLGSVVRICGERISLTYAKPYTLDENWKFDPENIGGANPSVAFYSLTGNERGVWAVASDGTYHFGKDAEPEFSPFPRFFHFPESGVDWSNPEFVLIATTKNQRFSVSGGSLILVPR